MNIIVILIIVILLFVSSSMSMTILGGVVYNINSKKVDNTKIETTSSANTSNTNTSETNTSNTNTSSNSDRVKEEIYNKNLASYKQNLENWEKAKKQREEFQKKWDERRDERMKSKEGERKQTKSGVNPEGQWCKNEFGNDWEEAERIMASPSQSFPFPFPKNFGMIECKKTEDARRREANEEESNIVPRMEDYNVPKPVEPSPP